MRSLRQVIQLGHYELAAYRLVYGLLRACLWQDAPDASRHSPGRRLAGEAVFESSPEGDGGG